MSSVLCEACTPQKIQESFKTSGIYPGTLSAQLASHHVFKETPQNLPPGRSKRGISIDPGLGCMTASEYRKKSEEVQERESQPKRGRGRPREQPVDFDDMSCDAMSDFDEEI